MDNFVMIQAGDLIDNSIGVAFGLATLTSAACGQIVSDVAGTVSGGAVDAMASSLGLPSPGLTAEQLKLRRVRLVGTAGAATGVAFGCLLGMSCLYFMDLEKADRLKRQGELHTLYATLMEEGHKLIGAQHCSLFLLTRSSLTAMQSPSDKVKRAFTGEDVSYAASGEPIHLTSMGWRGKEPSVDELQRTFQVLDKSRSGTVDEGQLLRR